MNPETKKTLQRRISEINNELIRLQTELDKAEIEVSNSKNKRDGLKSLLDNLQIEKQKIKEDIG